MRVSYDWLKTMIDIPEDPKTLSDEYIRTGTEVEAIDTVGESFDHVVTAKVLTKTPHPDSDHMYVCSVDVGDKNLDADGNPAPLQIVCGAQNFEAGDHIVTAMIGAVLPGDVKIKKSKLRGVVSMGMNCSARELGLSADHEGIMILPEDAPVGMPLAQYLGTADTVLVGFWCDKGACTPSVAALLSALHGKRVFLFGTCGFGADQSYYQQIIDRVTSNLAGDAELAGWAMCQGKMGPAVKQRYEAMLEQDPDNARYKMLLDNWVAAKDHPTKEDLDNMAAAAKKAVLGE